MVDKQSNLTAITNLRSFKPYWNGYTDCTFSNELCDFAEQVVTAFGDNLQPKLFPTGTGHIQLEFETDKVYIELELTGGHSAEFYIEEIMGTDTHVIEKIMDSCLSFDLVEFVKAYM